MLKKTISRIGFMAFFVVTPLALFFIAALAPALYEKGSAQGAEEVGLLLSNAGAAEEDIAQLNHLASRCTSIARPHRAIRSPHRLQSNQKVGHEVYLECASEAIDSMERIARVVSAGQLLSSSFSGIPQLP